MYARVCTLTYRHMHACTHTYTHTQHTHIHTQIHARTHTHTHIHTHTYTHTHRLSGRSRIVLGEEQPYYEYLPEVITNYCRCAALFKKFKGGMSLLLWPLDQKNETSQRCGAD